MDQINKEGATIGLLEQAQRKYSPYDRELLAIYTAIKHFWLKGRQLAVYSDHKSLIYAFNKNQLQSSPRQARHFVCISQFTTNIRYIIGKGNVMADTLSRIEGFNRAINIEALAEAQEEDEEFQQILKEKQLGIKLEKIPIPGTNKYTLFLWCQYLI